MHLFISKVSGSHRWTSGSRLMHSFISKESGNHRWMSGSRLNAFVYLQRVWESSLDVWIKAQYIRLSQETLKVIVGRLDQGSMHSFISRESERHCWTSGSRLNEFIYLQRVWESSLDVWIKTQCIRLSPKSLGVIVGRLDQGSMHSFISRESESHRWTSGSRLNAFVYLKRI